MNVGAHTHALVRNAVLKLIKVDGEVHIKGNYTRCEKPSSGLFFRGIHNPPMFLCIS